MPLTPFSEKGTNKVHYISTTVQKSWLVMLYHNAKKLYCYFSLFRVLHACKKTVWEQMMDPIILKGTKNYNLVCLTPENKDCALI